MDGEQLQLDNLVDLLLTEYNCGKCSQSLKASIIELIGVLFHKYPQSVLHRASTVQGLLIDTLDTVSIIINYYFNILNY